MAAGAGPLLVERRAPWINGPLSGGTGFTPGPRREGTPEAARTAHLLAALASVRFPATATEVREAVLRHGDVAEWEGALADLPEGPFANARAVRDALR